MLGSYGDGVGASRRKKQPAICTVYTVYYTRTTVAHYRYVPKIEDAKKNLVRYNIGTYQYMIIFKQRKMKKVVYLSPKLQLFVVA